jgi:pyrimidine deaminase RibD-like protein
VVAKLDAGLHHLTLKARHLCIERALKCEGRTKKSPEVGSRIVAGSLVGIVVDGYTAVEEDEMAA